MFCKNCGKELDGTKKFCSGCGNANSTIQDTHRETNTDTSSTVVRPPMPKKPWTKVRIIKTVLMVIVFGGLLSLKFIGGAINSLDNDAIDKNNSAQDSYTSGGDANKAIQQLQQASQDAVSNSTKMTTKVNLAYIYSSEGEEELALETFKEALPLASEGSLDYYLISGEIALLEGKSNSALLAYNKAYEKNPNDAQINNALGLFYLDIFDERPQYYDAVKALNYTKKAYEIQPSDITKENLGIAYYFNENYKQAISLLSSVAGITNRPYEVYWLGLAYVGDNQPTNAKYYLQIALDGGVEMPQEVINYINSN